MDFNSEEYSWADVSVAYKGIILEGCTGVKYTSKQEKELLYGRGNKPHKVIRGNKSYEGTLKLWQSLLEQMTAISSTGDLLDENFDLVVSYVPQSGGAIVVDILKGAEFTEVSKGMEQGDKSSIIELPITILSVKPQQ